MTIGMSGVLHNARKSIGITVVSGMLASTCIAVVFVPAFFVVLQRLSERRKPVVVRAIPASPQAAPPQTD